MRYILLIYIWLKATGDNYYILVSIYNTIKSNMRQADVSVHITVNTVVNTEWRPKQHYTRIQTIYNAQ